MAPPPPRSFSKWPIGSPEYNVEYIGGRTIAVSITFMILEVILTILRGISRQVSKTKYGKDDILILPSLFFCLAIAALAIVMVEIGGVGRHLPALATGNNPGQILHWAKSLVAVECIYCTAVVFPKLSILSFYLRIFTKKFFRITAYVVAGIMVANGIAGVVTSLVSCVPLAGRWDQALVAAGGSKCINVDNFWRWISFANILTDVVMLILPLPAIWSLQTSKNQKVGLTLIFLTGSVGLVSSIVRFAIFFDTEGFIDGTWTSGNLMIWTVTEPGVYHLAACLPTLRSLFLVIFPNGTTTTANKSYGPSGYIKSANKDIPLISRTGNETNVGSGFVRLDNDHSGNQDAEYASHQRDLNSEKQWKGNSQIRVTQNYSVEESNH